MAKYSYVAKKLKAWAPDTFREDTMRHDCWAKKGPYIISCFANGGDPNGHASCINLRHENDHDDIQTDYFAGSYFENVTQAINCANDGIEANERWAKHGAQ